MPGRPPRRRTPRARTARLVWVNRHLSVTPTVDTLGANDLLSGADNFMVFDTTIVQVVIPWLSFTFTTDATQALREMRVALIVGPSSLDSVDFTGLYANSVGPAWLWTYGTGLMTEAIGSITASLAGGGIDAVRVKSARRFRENESTLWLVHENRTEAGDSDLLLTGLIRTLIRVP